MLLINKILGEKLERVIKEDFQYGSFTLLNYCESQLKYVPMEIDSYNQLSMWARDMNLEGADLAKAVVYDDGNEVYLKDVDNVKISFSSYMGSAYNLKGMKIEGLSTIYIDSGEVDLSECIIRDVTELIINNKPRLINNFPYIKRVNMRGSILSNILFSYFNNVDFRDSTFTNVNNSLDYIDEETQIGVDFRGVYCKNCNFTNQYLLGFYFSRDTYFRDCDLNKTRMWKGFTPQIQNVGYQPLSLEIDPLLVNIKFSNNRSCSKSIHNCFSTELKVMAKDYLDYELEKDYVGDCSTDHDQNSKIFKNFKMPYTSAPYLT
jgi:uncharacterized protein YjbI with pentapeptide repeats